MAGRLFVLACVVGVSLVGFPVSADAQPPANPALDAPGFREHRDYFSQMPFEHIDALSGGLILTFTGLVLPGNAGRELRFQHTYNSKGARWTFGIAGIPLRILNPPVPTGVTPAFQEKTPSLHMADGSVRSLAWYAQPDLQVPSSFNIAISSDFAKFDRTGSARRLWLPNGDHCDYEADSGDWVRVSSCTDVFGNSTTFEWNLNPPELHVTQNVGDDSRLVVITMDDPTMSFPLEIMFDGRTWMFDRNVTTGQVDAVTPPAGPPWRFSYNSSVDDKLVSSIETPHGGFIDFDYHNQEYEGPDPQTTYWTLVITDRTMRDRGGAELGSWHYEYEIGQDGTSGLTTVTASDATDTAMSRTKYGHGWTESPEAVFDGLGGITPLVLRIVEKPSGGGWVVLEREERTYQRIRVLPWSSIVGTLELATRTITRKDGGIDTNYVTTLTYDANDFGDYHRPKTIAETGPAGMRSTAISYEHLTSWNILGLPKTETVTVGSESFSKSWTYDPDTGFRTAETIYDIKTDFGADAYGNVAWLKKANGKTTLFQYRYGQPKLITTPKYSITRSINPDGSIASETQAGRMTQFTYDDLGRPTLVQPPGSGSARNNTIIAYDNGGGVWVRTTRGTSEITVTLDGFGRRTEILNNVGVRTNTAYGAEGRVIKEGYPYRSGDPSGNTNIWTAIDYDALGRVATRTNWDASSSSRTYTANGVVLVTDELGHPTAQTWKGFGNPDESQLASVTDADGHAWAYTYNALGKLKTVSLDGTPIRAWTYYPLNGLLQTETHPESGTTTYYYDDQTGPLTGALALTVDAKGKNTTYEYDENDRVRKITADGRPTLITYESGSDNRTSALNGADGVIWRYELPTGRLQTRQDNIDGKSFTTSFEYDGNDNVRVIQYPSGRRIEFDVNAEGQATRVFEAAASRNYASAIAYHASGGVASYSSGNGITTAIEYDAARYWTTNITAGSLELGYSDYDFTGNPQNLSATSTGSTFNLDLTYDALDRLQSADGTQGTTTYAYDPHGNRTGDDYQINQSTLRLTNQDGIGFIYDNNGNATTIGNANFTYTPQNQVETAATPGLNVTYAYDADDQRVKKVSAGSSTYYIRGASGDLLTEWKDPGTSNGHIRDYIYLGSRLLSAVDRDSPLDPTGLNQPVTVSHRWATSYQVPDTSGNTAPLQGGISAVARKSTHPEMPRTGLRLGVETASLDFMRTGPMFTGNNTEQPKQGAVFLEFEVERYPYADTTEILRTNSGDLRLYITSAGELILKNDGGRPTPLTLWTSAPVGIFTSHTLELRFEYNSTTSFPPPNPVWENLTSWAQVVFDGALAASYGASPGGVWSSSEANPVGLDSRVPGTYWVNAELRSPGAANGLLMNIFRSGLTAAQNHGDSLEPYGTNWRTTLLQPDGAGTYSQWPNGQPDWRARSAVMAPSGFINPVTPTAVGQKVSYHIESMLSRGITGNIGAVLVGVRMQSASVNTKAFVRRNGVDTVLADLVLATQDFRWYRAAQSGWSPADVIEIGVTANATSNSLNSVALLVEHNTPEPEPLTTTSARVVTVNYSGNGGAQTIDFGLDQQPTVMFVTPAAGAPTNVEPVWWWDSRIGAALMTQSTVDFGRIWPQRGKFHVVHTSPKSVNASGVSYVAVALFDPSGRYVIPFAINKGSTVTDDDYTHYLRQPVSGELASTFTPDFVFGGAAFGITGDATRAALYRGPGLAPDLTAKLGTASAQGPDTDRIQALGAGTVQFGNGIDGANGDMAFWAGRVNDGVSSERLMAVTSYVGNGTASRNIELSLNGGSPVLVFVVPTNTSTKVFRVNTDSTGRNTASGNAVANSITALGINQITVGTALNANGVAYDVWAIKTGQVTP